MKRIGLGWLVFTVALSVACGGRSALDGPDVTVAAWGGATAAGGTLHGAASGKGGSVPGTGGSKTGGGGTQATTGGTTSAQGGTAGHGTGGGTPASGTGGSSSGSGGMGGTVPSSGSGGTPSVAGGAGEGDMAGAAGSTPSDCIVRVATSGSDTNDGSTFTRALRSVQRGLAAAGALLDQDDCSDVEVWVAAGTYEPTTSADRTISFELIADVALYGGFDGTETARDQRNIAANVTVLSGEIGSPSDGTDNSYHVVKGATRATLDGFTISGGFASGTSADLFGGGMYNQAASPTVSNCTFSNNVAGRGGGMYNESASPTVAHTLFTDNVVEFGDGGGMYNDHSSPVIESSSFTNNAAQYSGGGMYSYYSSPLLTRCTFTNNSARDSGGGMANSYSSSRVRDSTFTANSAYTGGGMDNHFAEVSSAVTGCTFTGNSAYSGGGIDNVESWLTVANSTFVGNTATGNRRFTNETFASGGGVYNYAALPTLTNCVFIGNSAVYAGGGVFNSNSASSVNNSTFTGNTAGSWGGALYDEEVSSALVANSIFWGDTVGSSVGELGDSGTGTAPTVTRCIVQGGDTSDVDIITADPLFVDAADGDLRLQAGSPAIDAGDGCGTGATLTDVAGDQRWDIASVANAVDGLDLGAFEYQGTAGVDAIVFAVGCF